MQHQYGPGHSVHVSIVERTGAKENRKGRFRDEFGHFVMELAHRECHPRRKLAHNLRDQSTWGGGSSSSQAHEHPIVSGISGRRIPEDEVGSTSDFPSNVLTICESVSQRGCSTTQNGLDI